ncbi:hypothetical protein HY385_01420 [Candidatus Daviesbacteria bacterium]|nr:hypothetical protein [Candidatus Daviesbacteria bacterium]
MIKKLALTLPGSNGTPIPTPVGFNPQLKDLGSIISSLANAVLWLSFFLMFFWIVWGVFQYLFASGNKENLDKARKRITYAIIGFIVIAIAFSVKEYLQTIMPPQNVPVQQVTEPK